MNTRTESGRRTGKLSKVLVIARRDNVAVALENIHQGEKVSSRIGSHSKTLCALQDIPKGHKIALVKISKGNVIMKYGEIIGYAKQDILEGEHTHVHNTVGRDEAR